MRARTLVYASRARENATNKNKCLILQILKIMAQAKEYTNIPKMGEVKKTELDRNELFLIVNVEDKYRISVANHWVTRKEFNTAKEAQEYIDSKPWELISNIAGVIAQFAINEYKKTDESNKQ